MGQVWALAKIRCAKKIGRALSLNHAKPLCYNRGPFTREYPSHHVRIGDGLAFLNDHTLQSRQPRKGYNDAFCNGWSRSPLSRVEVV